MGNKQLLVNLKDWEIAQTVESRRICFGLRLTPR